MTQDEQANLAHVKKSQHGSYPPNQRKRQLFGGTFRWSVRLRPDPGIGPGDRLPLRGHRAAGGRRAAERQALPAGRFASGFFASDFLASSCFGSGFLAGPLSSPIASSSSTKPP